MVTHPDIVQNTLHALIIEVHTYLKKNEKEKKKQQENNKLDNLQKLRFFLIKTVITSVAVIILEETYLKPPLYRGIWGFGN